MKPLIFKPTDKQRVLKAVEIRLNALKSDKQYKLEIKEHRKKRSLDSNAYAWELLSKIAEIVGEKKEEIYFQMLKSYGQQFLVKIPKHQVELFEKSTQYFEEHEKLFDDKAIYYKVFVGSSNYNTKEMSVLIEGIVQECKQLGIETMTPQELERLIQNQPN